MSYIITSKTKAKSLSDLKNKGRRMQESAVCARSSGYYAYEDGKPKEGKSYYVISDKREESAKELRIELKEYIKKQS